MAFALMGKTKVFSKMVFKAAMGRQALPPYKFADESWLDPCTRINPLACGQLVNNGGQRDTNVTYYELDLNLRSIAISNRKWLINVPNGPVMQHQRHVVLLSTRDIPANSELLSSYFSITERDE